MSGWWVWPAVVLAGAAGALARYGVAELARVRWTKKRLGVTVANMVGAALAGGLVALDHPIAFLIAAGFAGSLTTFSTIVFWIATDTVDRKLAAALEMSAVHILAGIPAGFIGFVLTTAATGSGLG